jgi:fatty acid desaturase
MNVIDKALATLFVKKSYNSEVATQIINKGLNQVRVDTVIIVLVWGTGFYLYGAHWYILALFFLTRGFMISFLDYVYHYNTPVNDVKHGYNLELPWLLEKYLLNFNLHGIHHLYPQENWEKLPELFKKNGGKYDKNYFLQSINQLRGTIKST